MDLEYRVHKVPGVCGGSAHIALTRIPVWLLQSYKEEGLTDGELRRMFPVLERDDLQAAWKYVEDHRQELDEEIEDNRP